jgi:hypothetical protein
MLALLMGFSRDCDIRIYEQAARMVAATRADFPSGGQGVGRGAGHPVITERLVVTGSPAFAGDDDGKLNDPTKIITL